MPIAEPSYMVTGSSEVGGAGVPTRSVPPRLAAPASAVASLDPDDGGVPELHAAASRLSPVRPAPARKPRRDGVKGCAWSANGDSCDVPARVMGRADRAGYLAMDEAAEGGPEASDDAQQHGHVAVPTRRKSTCSLRTSVCPAFTRIMSTSKLEISLRRLRHAPLPRAEPVEWCVTRRVVRCNAPLGRQRTTQRKGRRLQRGIPSMSIDN